MNELLTWLESSALGHVMRNLGVWSYAVVNLTHVLGVSTLFGSLLVLDLRLLGVWSQVSLSAIATPAVPIATIGFVVAVISGTCLITTNATEYVGNPFLLIKFPAIALGVLNVGAINLLPGWRARNTREPSASERRRLAVAGGLSLTCWLTAVAAGRMIGYW